MENKVIFESEEEARKMLHVLWLDYTPESEICALKRLEQAGYIRKSPVEEAEEMLYDWKAGHTTDINDMVVKSIEAIQYLKAEKAELANCINNYVNKNIEANKGLIPESILNDMYKLEIELLQKHEVKL